VAEVFQFLHTEYEEYLGTSAFFLLSHEL